MFLISNGTGILMHQNMYIGTMTAKGKGIQSFYRYMTQNQHQDLV